MLVFNLKNYNMKKIRICVLPLLALICMNICCKKQLEVGNPNEPKPEDARSEPGILALARGAVYVNGFNGINESGLNTLGTGFFSNAFQFHELLADVVSSASSNQNINVISLPQSAVLDDGTKLSSTASQRSILRISNARSSKSSNAFYYEWGYMYALNNACNNLLSQLSYVKFTGDQNSKVNTIKAWAYYWKGYAYSRLGSLYYSGIINDEVLKTNNKYVDHNSLIAEANKNFDASLAALDAITVAADYNLTLTKIIPEFLASGRGGVLSISEWKHNINTMKARNILVNKKVSDMTSTDWNNIITLTLSGIQKGDLVFTARTASNNGFMASSNGSIAAQTTGAGSTFVISERFIQEYYTGDKRLANNFSLVTRLNSTGGYTFSTRYRLLNGGNKNAGVVTYSDKTPGNYEAYPAGTYEENALMLAEALINTGQVDQGLALIDAVRTYQGAGIAAVSGTGLTAPQAEEQLRRERRVALVFRGVSFYDYRRFGFIYDISKGGGRTGAVVLTPTGQLNSNVTINYNFLDYWDVPADETDLNPPAAGSAPVINPN
ncbi:MAG: hypothetical protein NVSMB45_17970 [Ginsengibacter sp.]